MSDTATAARADDLLDITASGDVFLTLEGKRYKLSPLNPFQDRDLIYRRVVESRPDPAAALRAAMDRLKDLPPEVREAAVRETALQAYADTKVYLSREPAGEQEVQAYLAHERSEGFRAWLLLRDNPGMTEERAAEICRSMDRARWQRVQGEANRAMVDFAKKYLAAKAEGRAEAPPVTPAQGV